ncbi:hypothetical protein DNX69_04065 [Rhodopseudomonas palustris]|uniref:Transmembrane protein n=1 Tax=Rhodopseudomonas palustris TaxID=1076 RepID=A0A323ULX1_RHOPL|nr:hypothetical protein [Rhodopseudomonas palustris]PZA13544.1 hypothetical protein DNX69_04065 [Rhodopseudomonas palustris]
MQYWIIAFTAALVVVIGYAAGPVGAAVSLLAFAGSLYLMWARKLGFAGAWTRFALDRFSAPFWKGENWERFNAMFHDSESVVKAATIATALVALALILPPSQVALIAVVVAAWYAFEVYRSHRPLTRPTTAIEAKSATDTVIYAPARSESTTMN